MDLRKYHHTACGKRGRERRTSRVLLGSVLLCATFLVFGVHNFAHAVLYNASGILGQTDVNGNPTYTKSSVNNGPGNSGFYQATVDANLAVDTVNHRLFVADNVNSRVLVFPLDANNNLIGTSTASYVLGQPNFQSSIATTTQSGMNGPSGLAFDVANQRLFVSESTSRRVLVFNVATSTITNGENASYVLGEADFTSSSGGTTQNRMNGPQAVSYDATNQRLFVGDSLSNRVLVFNVATSSIVNGENASNVLGQSGFTSSTASTTQAGMNTPNGLAFDSTNQVLFVSDTGNNRVLTFGVASGTILTTSTPASYVLGQVNFTSSTAAVTQNGMKTINGLAFDDTNQRLFVSNGFGADRVMIFNVASGTIANGENAVHVLGQTNFTNATASTTQTGMNTPLGLAFDVADQRLFVADGANFRVLSFNAATSTITDGENASGIVGQTDVNGNPTYTKSSPNNGPGNSGFSFSVGTNGSSVAIDTVNHRMFVPDINANRVLVFPLDANNNIIGTSTASYVLGQPNFQSNTLAETQSGMALPLSVAYDPVNQRLFVVDNGNRRVLVFNVATSSIANNENASNVINSSNFTGNGINFPANLAFDATNQRLFVSGGNNGVLVYNVAPGTILTTSTPASYILGQTNFTSSTAATTQTGMSNPSGLAYDSPSQRLFVLDTSNNRVLVFNVATSSIVNGENASNVLGQSDFTSSTASTTQSGLKTLTNNKGSLAYDPALQSLFVADMGNNRIMVFNVATSSIANGENASNVINVANFTTVGSNVMSQLSFNIANNGAGLAFDPAGRHLFIMDGNNNRVLQDNFVSITTQSLPGGTRSQSYATTTIGTASSQGTVSFKIVSGSLPAGLTLASSTGIIAGTPTVATTTTFTIEADDTSSTGIFAAQQAYTMNIGSDDAIPPSVAWTAPANNATVSSTVTLTASSTDNIAVGSVAFYQGSFGSSFASSTLIDSTSTPSGTLYSIVWNTSSTPNGSSTLWALSTDTSNNTSTASTTVNVENVPVISATSTTPGVSSTAAIAWTTSFGATSQVNYGLTSGYGSSTATSTLVTSHSITLTGLASGQTYHFQILSTDSQGNTATTTDGTFVMTLDVTPPQVAWTAPANNATVSSTVTLTASSTDNIAVGSVAFYQGSFGATFASSSLIGSTSTPSGTLYSISWNTSSTPNGSSTLWVLSTDTSNNTSTASTTVNVENPPMISGMSATPGSTSTAAIAWTTRFGATSQVNYGLTSGYGSSTATSTLVTSHAITLTGLSSGQAYHFQILSTDVQGNTATTTDGTFSSLVPSFAEYFSASSSASSSNSWTITAPSSTAMRWQNIGEQPGLHTAVNATGSASAPWNVGTNTFDLKADITISTGSYSYYGNQYGAFIGVSTDPANALTSSSLTVDTFVNMSGLTANATVGNEVIGQGGDYAGTISGYYPYYNSDINWPNVNLGGDQYVSSTQVTVEIRRTSASTFTFTFWRPDYQGGLVPWYAATHTIPLAQQSLNLQYVTAAVTSPTNPQMNLTFSNIRGYSTAATSSPTVSSTMPVAPATYFQGGVTADVNGTGFQSGAQVVIGVTSPTITPVYVSSTYISSSDIQVVLPSLPTGSYGFKVLNPDSSDADLVGGITYYGGPAVSEIDPWEANPNGGDVVTLVGQGFTSTTTVTFGGNPGTSVTLIDPFHLQVTTPAGTVGAKAVVAIVGGSPAAGSPIFGYSPHPYMLYNGTSSLATLQAQFNDPAYVNYKNQILALASTSLPNNIYNSNGIWSGGDPSYYLLPWLLQGDTQDYNNLWTTLNAELTHIDFTSTPVGNAGFRTMALAGMSQAYDALFPYLTPTQKTSFLKYLRNGFNQFADWDVGLAGNGNYTIASLSGDNYSNRTTMANNGAESAVALMYSVPSTTPVINKAVANDLKYASSTPSTGMVSSDGGDVESALYWGYGMNSYLQFAHALLNATGTDMGLLSVSTLAKNYLYPQALFGPDGNFVPFNDAQPQVYGVDVMADQGNRYNNPFLQYLANYAASTSLSIPQNYNSGAPSGYGIGNYAQWAFLWVGSSTAPALFPGFASTTQVLNVINQGAMRSDTTIQPNLYVAVKGADNGFGHEPEHNDDSIGSFVVESHGEDFLIDPGYNQGSVGAHTMPVIDVPISSTTITTKNGGYYYSYGSTITSSTDQNGVRSMLVDSSAGYNNAGAAAKVRRIVTAYGDRAVVILDDDAPTSSNPGSVISLFQTGNNTTINTSTKTFTITGASSTMQGKFFGPSVTVSSTGPNDFGTSWIYKGRGVQWYSVQASYTIASSTPLVTVLTPSGSGVNGATATAVNYNGSNIAVQLSDGTSLNFVQSGGNWAFSNATTTNPPTISLFNAVPSSIASGSSTSLSWSTMNANTISITPGSFTTSTDAGNITVSPTSTTIYTLTATNGNGAATSTVIVTVAGSNPGINSFSASPAAVAPAGTSTLSWDISSASSVAITPASFSTSTLIGSTTVNPTSTTVYILTATNGNGTSTASTTVTVSGGGGDSTIPLVTWTAPANNATVSSTVTLTASSTDNIAVGSVAFYQGSFGATFASSSLIGSTSTPSGTLYSISWNTSSTPNGSSTLWVLSTDTSNNTSTASTTVNVENPPMISGMSATPGSTSTAAIAWTTRFGATSQVNYGLTSGYGSSTATSTLVTSHSVTLTGLAASTTYHYQILSTDVQGNTATTTDGTFVSGLSTSLSFTVGSSTGVSIFYNGQNYYNENGLADGGASFGPTSTSLFFGNGSIPRTFTSDNTTYDQVVYNPGSSNSLTIRTVYTVLDSKTLQVDAYVTNNDPTNNLNTATFVLFPLQLPATATQAFGGSGIALSPQDVRFSDAAGFLSNTWGSLALWMNDYTNASSNIAWTYAPSSSVFKPNLATYSQDHNGNDIGGPIAPGQTLHVTDFLRFGTASDTSRTLAPEAYAAFSSTYPYLITNWPDRRPIANWFLADTGHASTTNPRGYFNNPSFDVSNQSAFNAQMLANASATLANMNAMTPKPQGIVIWDLEGQEFAQPFTYVGYPSRLPTMSPEMDSVADQFFKIFRDGGYKVGMTLRPDSFLEGTVVPPSCTYNTNFDYSQVFIQDSTSSPYFTHTGWVCTPSSTFALANASLHYPNYQNVVTNASNTAAVDDAAVVANLAPKVAYARNRWGAKIFYVDSTVYSGGGTVDFTIFRQLQQQFPDCLFFPEESTNGTWGATAPYKDNGGLASFTSATNLYPQAFELDNVSNIALSASSTNFSKLQGFVASGSILMFPGWYTSWQNSYVNSIYAAAGLTSNPTDTTAPSVPSGISPTPISSTSIALNWTASSDDTSVDGYQVFRNGTQIATTTESNYTDTGLTASTTYSYTIDAFDAAGNTSAQSSSTLVTTLGGGATVPTAPQSLSATRGNAAVSLTWSAPASNGSSSLTQYLVYDRFTGSSTFALYTTTTASQTTSTVTSLTNGQSYDFEILAQNSVGTSTASNIVSSTPFTVPNAPTSVSASAGNAEATISFSPGSNGGSTILYYTATSNPSNISATSTGTPIVVTSLTNGTSYTFTVTATNAAGVSTPSSASNSVTPINLAPAISSFTASPTSIIPGASSALSWATTGATTVSLDNGIGSVATSTGSVVVSPASTTIYTLTATNANGTSAAQATVLVTANNPPPPSSSGGSVGVASGYGASNYQTVTTVPPPSSPVPPPSAPSSVASLQILLNSLITQLRSLLAQAASQGISLPAGSEAYLLSGSGSASNTFTRDLQLGMTGADVTALQNFLVSENKGTAARKLATHGVTRNFASLTKAALVEFQQSVGITPAIGYFGPITRAYVKTLME